MTVLVEVLHNGLFIIVTYDVIVLKDVVVNMLVTVFLLVIVTVFVQGDFTPAIRVAVGTIKVLP